MLNGIDGLPGCLVHPNVAAIGFFVTGQVGIASGYVHHDFYAPSPSVVDLVLEAQWLTLDSNATPAGLSEAMRFVIRQ